MFSDAKHAGGDAFQSFQRASNTAYTEFGVPSISPMDALKKIITPEELSEIAETPSWLLHHAVKAWSAQSHACLEILKTYFGENATVEERVAQSDLLQVAGMKTIFEEARRQSPKCSATLNWCFNEPWITAANCSVVRYPAIPKPGYYAIKEALRPTLFSARIPVYDWRGGERFTAGIWLLNDSNAPVKSKVEVTLQVGEEIIHLLSWNDAETAANQNREGATVCCTLPAVDAEFMTLRLRSEDSSLDSEYRLHYRRSGKPINPRAMNM